MRDAALREHVVRRGQQLRAGALEQRERRDGAGACGARAGRAPTKAAASAAPPASAALRSNGVLGKVNAQQLPSTATHIVV